MTEFIVNDINIKKMVMGYLREKGLYDTLSTMQLETNSSEGNISEELLFLQKIVLQGRWSDVISYLRPLKTYIIDYEKIEYYIKKQQFLEALTWQDIDNNYTTLPWKPIKSNKDGEIDESELDIDMLVLLLQEMDGKSDPIEFNSLCTCLTLEKLSDHPMYKNWTISKGRFECFQKLRGLLYDKIPGNNSKIPSLSSNNYDNDSNPCGLISMISMGIAYQNNNNNNDNVNNKVLNTIWNDRIISPASNEEYHIQVPYLQIRNNNNNNNEINNDENNISNQNIDNYEIAENPISASDNNSHRNGENNLNISNLSNNDIIANKTKANRYEKDSSKEKENRRKSEAWNVPVDDVTNDEIIKIADAEVRKSINSPKRKVITVKKKAPVSWTVEIDTDTDRTENIKKISPKNDIKESNVQEERLKINPNFKNAPIIGKNRSNNSINKKDILNNNSNIQDNKEDDFSKKNDIIEDDFILNEDDISKYESQLENREKSWVEFKDNNHITTTITDEDNINNYNPSQYSHGNFSQVNDKNKDWSALKKNSNIPLSTSKNNIKTGGISSVVSEHVYYQQDKGDDYTIATTSTALSTVSGGSIISNNSRTTTGYANKYENNNNYNKEKQVKNKILSNVKISLPNNEIENTNFKSGKSFSSFYEVESNKWENDKKQLEFVNPVQLFQSSCPLRCLSILNNTSCRSSNSKNNSGNTNLSIGSNAKSIHNLSYISCSVKESNICNNISNFEDVHKGSVYAMDWDRENKLIASGSNDKAIRISNIDSLSMLPLMKGHNGTIRCVKFREPSLGNSVLASAGAGDFKTRIWDVTAGVCQSILTPHQDVIQCLHWIDNNLVMTGCELGEILVHDIRTDMPAWSINIPNSGPGNTFKQDKFGLCSMHSINEDLLFIGCTKGIVTVLNTNERRVLLAEKLHNDDVKGIYELNSASKDPFVVSASFDGSAAVWKVDHSTLQRQQRYGSGDKAFHMQSSLLGHTDKILGLSVDNITNDIVTSGADGKVLLWQANMKIPIS